MINTYILTLPQGGGDAIGFENAAYSLSISNYDIDYLYYFTSGVRLFELLGSYIYVIVGRQPIILGLTIVLLGVYTVKLVYKATLLLWRNKKVARKAAWFTALFPTLMLHSALFLREVPVNVFLLLSIISFIKYWQYHKSSQIIGFIIYAFGAAIFHSGSLFLLIGFVYIIGFHSKGKGIGLKITALILIISMLFIINSTGIGINKLGGSFDSSLELLETRENYTLKGDSAYPSWIMLTGGINDFIKIPIRIIAFLFSPLIPFWARSFWHAIGLIDASLYLFMFYTFIRKRKIFKINKTAKALLIMTLFLILVFSLGVANVGTAIRHRAKMAPLLIVIFTGLYYYKVSFFLNKRAPK